MNISMLFIDELMCSWVERPITASLAVWTHCTNAR